MDKVLQARSVKFSRFTLFSGSLVLVIDGVDGGEEGKEELGIRIGIGDMTQFLLGGSGIGIDKGFWDDSGTDDRDFDCSGSEDKFSCGSESDDGLWDGSEFEDECWDDSEFEDGFWDGSESED